MAETSQQSETGVMKSSADGTEAPETGADYPSPGYAWYMVILLLVVYTFSFIDRQILGLLGPTIIKEFDLSDSEFGWLVGFGFALFYTLFGLFCARISDGGSRKWLIAVGVALWSIMTTLSGVARNYWELFAYRVGVGVGEATLGPAANSMLSDSFPRDRLATALSVYAMGIPVGSGLAFIVGGTVISLASQLPDIVIPGVGSLAGWQKAFMIVGLPGLLLAVLVSFLTEPSRKGKQGAAASVPLSEVFGFFKSKGKAFIAVIVGVSINAAIGFGSAIWVTAFMVRYHGMEPHDVGLIFGAIVLATGPTSLVLLGKLADRRAKAGRSDAMIRTLMIAPIGFFIPMVAFPFMETAFWAFVMLAVGNFFISSPSGVAYTALQIITPNQMRGQAVALYIFSTSMIGYGGGAYLIGLMSDMLVPSVGPESLRWSLIIFALVTAPLCLAFYLWGRQAFADAVELEEARLKAL